MVNCDTYSKSLNKAVFPKNLKTVTAGAFEPLTSAEKVYFTGVNPPKMKNVFNIQAYAVLPVFTDVYVPKKAYKAYKKWYKAYDCYSSVKLHKFNP